MQKILRINIQARNQAAKRARKTNFKQNKSKWREHEQASVMINRANRDHVKEEQKARREDWMLGPLAPNREAGKNQGAYGTISQRLARGPEIPKLARRGPKSNGWDGTGDDWVGEGQEGNIALGDRVCVIRGPEGVKGRIGTVGAIDADHGELVIIGVNMADVETSLTSSIGLTEDKFRSTELPVKFEDVRLVYRMVDDETGLDRDVIIRHLRGGPPYVQREFGSNIPRHTRYIAGQEIEIPWPDPEIPEVGHQESDTNRFDVEELTYMPSALLEPMPENVIDEIRSKYNPGRPYHDNSWVAMKVVEDARSSWWENRSLLTPSQEKQKIEMKKAIERSQRIREEGPSQETLRIIAETQAESMRSRVGN